MKPPSGIGLGRPVKRVLQGTDRIHSGSTSGGTSSNSTHRAPPSNSTHRRSSGPSLTAGSVVRSARTVIWPPPTPTQPAAHFPGSPVIGHGSPAAIRAVCRAGEGLPSSRRHCQHVPRPIRRGVPHGRISRIFAASMAFAPIVRGSALPYPAPKGRHSNDAAGFALCYGPHCRSPLTGPLTLGFDPARFQTKPPACYRASWQLPGPDFHRQATTSLRTAGSAATSRLHLPFRWAHTVCISEQLAGYRTDLCRVARTRRRRWRLLGSRFSPWPRSAPPRDLHGSFRHGGGWRCNRGGGFASSRPAGFTRSRIHRSAHQRPLAAPHATPSAPGLRGPRSMP